jgi:hypothetical protein
LFTINWAQNLKSLAKVIKKNELASDAFVSSFCSQVEVATWDLSYIKAKENFNA